MNITIPTRLAGPQGGFEARRSDLSRIDDFTIKNTRVSGIVEVSIAPLPGDPGESGGCT